MKRWTVAGWMIVASTVATSAHAVPYFQTPTTYGTSEWTNYVRFADLDGDGDPDVLAPSCAGFFGPPTAGPFVVYENQNGSLVDVTLSALGSTPDLAVRVVAVGDIDGDGDLDLYLPSAGGQADRLYVNDGDGGFVDEAATRLPAGTASRSAGARFGDLDGDGDLDLFVAQGYASSDMPLAVVYENDGAGVFTPWPAAIPTSGPGTDPDDVDLLDVDRDFDLDVLINAHSGKSSLWRNDGGAFTDITDQMAGPATNNFHYNPSACDVDGDGDLDLWVDNIGGGFEEQLLINDGAGVFTDETGTKVLDNVGADDNGVMCVDVDDDGDFDAVIPSLSDNERVLLNDGAGNFTLVADDGFPSVSDPTLWIDFADVDGDGRLDAFTGQGEGANTVNRLYLGNTTNQPVDSRPPVIVAQQAPPAEVEAGTSLALRFAVTDRSVGDGGPLLGRAFARVTIDATTTEVDARFAGGDLFHVALVVDQPLGATVGVTLCATDPEGHEGCGSAQSFVVADATSSGAGGAGGAGGGGTVGAGGSTASTTAGAGGASSASGGPLGPVEVDDGGCGCRLAGAPRPRGNGLAGWLTLAGLLVGRRRRRRG